MLTLLLASILFDNPAQYSIRLAAVDPPRYRVHAELPIAGDEIRMARTRPGDIPEILTHGWPALVKDLRIVDEGGRQLEAAANGPGGWRLTQPVTGRITLDYELDYGLLKDRGWPAPREAAYADRNHVVTIGRSMFITTPQVRTITVEFKTSRPWRAVAPWERKGNRYIVQHPDDLADNLVALTTQKVETVVAGNLQVLLVPIGHWLQARSETRRLLRSAIPRLAELMPLDRREQYLAVLLPQLDQGRGAESFRRSMAITMDTAPSRANVGLWGNTIAHEIFHTWNGWSVKPADYGTSQWFQEGVTEYASNLSLVRSGVITEREFVDRLSQHVRNYRKLTTSLGAHATQRDRRCTAQVRWPRLRSTS